MSTHADVGFFLNGGLLPNNSIVENTDIGEGSDALYCLTDRVLCCSTAAGGRHGLWKSPNGLEDSQITREFSSLLLNRRNNGVAPTGIYTCLVPDANNIIRTLYIGIYGSVNAGEF